MPISPARRIAFEVLRRVQTEGAYANDVLHSELNARVKPEDAALATELVLGVLRWQRLLDFLLEKQTKKPPERLDLAVSIALRIGLYQIRFLRKIPLRAAVYESVELVKRGRKSSAASLVNAVLRRSAESIQPVEGLLPDDISHAERLGILYSHPTWIVERWLVRFGEARTIALLEANNRPPRLSCTLHNPGEREQLFASLKRASLRVEPGTLLHNAFAVSGRSPARTEPFRAGQFSIQDEASQGIPLLLGVQTGDRVLDLCAAPGGKTPPLVRAAGQNGLVVATDRHAHRLRDMKAQFVRLGLSNVPLVELDASRPLPFRSFFNRILVDAPCSGTGTLARHPEIRWRLRPQQLSELHQVQIALLAAGLAQLAPGGRLVYSTCSLEPEENEEVVAEVLHAVRSVRRVSPPEATRLLAPHLVAGISATTLLDSDGQFRTLPGDQNCDGFFAAILERR
ncbi:MAG: 16S rRNA (cytosine(967)-C(5))-methyltransferase RsmB [Candidatus Acidiferrales bacterium]